VPVDRSLSRRVRSLAPNGAGQGDRREVAMLVAYKGNVPVRHRVRPRRERSRAARCALHHQKPGAHHPKRVSSRASEARDDRALAENWAACWSKRTSTNMQMMQSRAMEGAVVVADLVAPSRHETGGERPWLDVSVRHAVRVACVQG